MNNHFAYGPKQREGSLRLRRLWRFRGDKSLTTWHVSAVAFSEDGRLGVASACAYVLTPNGGLTSAECGEGRMRNVSYCCGRFGFVNWSMDDIIECNAYVYDVKTGKWKSVLLDVRDCRYNWAIAMLEDGFLAGYKRLAYFDFEGNKRWDVEMEWISESLATYEGTFTFLDIVGLLVIREP